MLPDIGRHFADYGPFFSTAIILENSSCVISGYSQILKKVESVIFIFQMIKRRQSNQGRGFLVTLLHLEKSRG
jgi:hypothetical protein